MGVKIQESLEYLGWRVLRFRGVGEHTQALTQKGWVDVKQGQQLEFDETMIWDREDLQELVEELHKHQIRPREASYTEGKLEATTKHLEDMRQLALKQPTKPQSKKEKR